jgi:hypothetical protein
MPAGRLRLTLRNGDGEPPPVLAMSNPNPIVVLAPSRLARKLYAARPSRRLQPWQAGGHRAALRFQELRSWRERPSSLSS